MWRDERMAALRHQVFVRDFYTCQDCRRGPFPEKDLECDHIVPIAKGGKKYDPENCQTLCKYCHRKKTKKDFKGRWMGRA
jgi:5-methylcytosine-specific restriction endonuclease McrA